MISGRVTPDGREALIPVTLLGRAGTSPRVLEAVIDTGFTNRLTLPPELVEEQTSPRKRVHPYLW